MSRRRFSGPACAGLASFVAGCAFGDRHVELAYPPDAEAATVEAAARPDFPAIALGEFTDQRDRGIVGEVRNGWGMHTADVVTETSVPEWVRGAIAYELRRAGLQVLEGNDEVASIRLDGEVVTVFCSALASYEGEVSFFASMTRSGQELIDQRYTGRASSGVNWAATSGSYEEAQTLSLQDAVLQLVDDVRSKVPTP